MMNEDRPYAGILMNDGTEIAHYGVKGMKWGKKIFGKVKGIFGKPDPVKAQTKIQYKGSKNDPNAVSRKGKEKNQGPSIISSTKKTGTHAVKGYTVERDADGKPFYSKTRVRGKNTVSTISNNKKKK